MSEERPVEDLVTWELDDDGIATITIDRADKGNSLTMDMRDRLADLFIDASGDLRVRVIVLAAAGDRHFCTGADVRGGSKREPKPRPEDAPDRATGDVARMIRIGWQRLIAAILDCDKPVIGRINGTAAGGGLHLALAPDLVIAADSARFISAFVRRGIAPDAGGAYLIPRLVGPQRAKQLMFFGDDLPASEAERWGLINRCVPADELDAAVDEWAARLAAAPTQAIVASKTMINRSLDSDRETAFLEEAYFQELVQGTHDAREGMMSFVERRDPEFKGW